MFSMNSTFTASFLDLDVDDLQFMFSLAYAAIVCTLLVHVRFFHFFNIRTYLLVMTLLSMIILFGMTLTKNTQLMFILRLIQGPLTLLEGCILLPLIMGQLKQEHSRIIGYSILYCFMMIGDKLTTSLVKFAIENYSHNTIIYSVICFHALALTIYLLLFNQNRLFPHKPLYQFHLSGVILLLISLVAGAYFFIYGRKLYWFESNLIISSFVLMLIFGALFIWYQYVVKRPLFHFEVLSSERVLLGIFLFFAFYVIRASLSNLYQIMSIVWKWPWTNVLSIQYANVLGTIIGIVLSAILMIRKVPYRLLFTMGFALLGGSMYWFYKLCVPDISPIAIAQPLLLEGIAQGVLFTPLVLYMLGSVRPDFSSNGSLIGTSIRFWSATIGYSIMKNCIQYLTTKYLWSYSGTMIQSDQMVAGQWQAKLNQYLNNFMESDAVSLAATDFNNELYNHALLLSNMQIFYSLGIAAFLLAIICFAYQPIKNRWLFYKNGSTVLPKLPL